METPFAEPGDCNGAQLLFNTLIYAYVLYQASNLISDGSELLLLVPSMAKLVGSIILPILGAVPDGMMVLFSGLGPDAQNQLSVGVGALAGSTAMLLTFPWFIAILYGSVDLDEQGVAIYKKGSEAESKGGGGCLRKGITYSNTIKKSATVMLLTTLLYLIIQLPASHAEGAGEATREQAASEQVWALTGLVCAVAGFIGYLVYCYLDATEDKQLAELIKGIGKKKISLGAALHYLSFFVKEQPEKKKPTPAPVGTAPQPSSVADPPAETPTAGTKGFFSSFFPSWMGAAEGAASAAPATAEKKEELNQPLLETGTTQSLDEEGWKTLRKVVKPFFAQCDTNQDGSINLGTELWSVLKLMGLRNATHKAEIEEIMKSSDTDKDSKISFKEFCLVLHDQFVCKKENLQKLENTKNIAKYIPSYGEEDEEEEVPADLADLPERQQMFWIVFRSCWMMGLGTLLVLMFSDPMVDVLSEWGKRLGVSPFYVSFLLAPFASNASELLSAYNYAVKKSQSSITTSLSTLVGAACMNNTLGLAIFLALVYFKDLAWKFTAETIAIMVVQWVLGFLALKSTTQTTLTAFFILACYPGALFLVWYLENKMGMD